MECFEETREDVHAEKSEQVRSRQPVDGRRQRPDQRQRKSSQEWTARAPRVLEEQKEQQRDRRARDDGQQRKSPNLDQRRGDRIKEPFEGHPGSGRKRVGDQVIARQVEVGDDVLSADEVPARRGVVEQAVRADPDQQVEQGQENYIGAARQRTPAKRVRLALQAGGRFREYRQNSKSRSVPATFVP